MSADNFIAIIEKDKEFIGYYCCASHDFPHIKCFPCIGKKIFRTATLKAAILVAQSYNTEYGYSYYEWKKEPKGNCPCKTKRFIEGMGEPLPLWHNPEDNPEVQYG